MGSLNPSQPQAIILENKKFHSSNTRSNQTISKQIDKDTDTSRSKRSLNSFKPSHQTVLFTNDIELVNIEKDHVNYSGLSEQDVLYINERQVMVRSKDMYNRKPSVGAEGVFADLQKR